MRQIGDGLPGNGLRAGDRSCDLPRPQHVPRRLGGGGRDAPDRHARVADTHNRAQIPGTRSPCGPEGHPGIHADRRRLPLSGAEGWRVEARGCNERRLSLAGDGERREAFTTETQRAQRTADGQRHLTGMDRMDTIRNDTKRASCKSCSSLLRVVGRGDAFCNVCRRNLSGRKFLAQIFRAESFRRLAAERDTGRGVRHDGREGKEIPTR